LRDTKLNDKKNSCSPKHFRDPLARASRPTFGLRRTVWETLF